MLGALTAPFAICLVAALATAGVILRPFAWPEFVWAIAGAALLVALGLLPAEAALAGALRGGDVYLFLAGMMLLAELARLEGLFDWVAARAASGARGSASRLFALVFAVGTAVTALLSNDATAVVLTPAVAAVARAARAGNALPYLYACAFIANAASFVLPISNPANLVLYGKHMPPLLEWLPRYGLASALSIGATFIALRWSQRHALRELLPLNIERPALSTGGRTAALGIALVSVALLAASAFDLQLGLPTFLAGAGTTALILVRERRSPARLLRGISWGVLPLVAGLFVLVEALDRIGAAGALAARLAGLERDWPSLAPWIAGFVLGFGSNAVNNLPAGLLAGRIAEMAQVGEPVRAALLIGVDLGPNLSVTGSLATILWLAALRREGFAVGTWTFLRLGAIVMPPALLLAIAGSLLTG